MRWGQEPVRAILHLHFDALQYTATCWGTDLRLPLRHIRPYTLF